MNLIDTKGFNTRFECGASWSDGLILSHMVSDFVTALCFFAVPATLIWCARKRHDLPFRKEVILFSVGTVLCGFVHLSASILPYWWPAYRFDAALKAANALAWVFIAFTVMIAVPKFIRMLTPLRVVRMQAELMRTPITAYSHLVEYLAERKVVIDDSVKKDFEILDGAVAGLKSLEKRVEDELK